MLQDRIIVKVGPELRKYYIHKDLLTHYSEYFRKALCGVWKEADEGMVCLSDIEPGIFNVFVNWIYTHNLPATQNKWVEVAEVKEEDCKGKITREVSMVQLKTCVLGDRLMTLNFHRIVSNAFIDNMIRIRRPPYYKVINYAYKNLPQDNKILDLLAHQQCYRWHEDSDGKPGDGEFELRSQLPQSFLFRVMVRYSKGRVTEPDPCGYHEHASEEEEKTCRERLATEMETEDSEDSEDE